MINSKKSKTLILVFVLLALGSCYESMPKSWNWGAKSRPLTGVRGFPEAYTDYGRGFKSGCEIGWSTVEKGLKDLAKPHLSPEMMSGNKDYATGWWDGFEQCVYIVDWDVL